MKKNYAENYETLYTPDIPELGTGPISVDSYISEEIYEKEIEYVFRKSWFYVCSASELKETGSYVVKEIPHLKKSLILVKDTSGDIKGFENACKHRGNRLIYDECPGKKTATFVCPFHGWAYNLDGTLRGIPERDRFFDIDTSTLSLTPITVAVWNGLVFYHPESKPEKSIKEYLGGMGESLKRYPFGEKVKAAEWSVEVDANWKVFVDAFQEGYHVAVVHKRTAPKLFTGSKRPSCRLSNFRLHENHRAVTTPMNPDFVPSETEALSFKLAGSALSQDGMAQRAEDMGINPGGEKDFSFDINVIFPTTFLDTSVGWYFSYEFWPVSKNKTKWVAKFYADPVKTWSERIGLEFTIVQLREALFEDLTTIEMTQKGLESGAIQQIVLSDQELAIRHQHQVLDKILSNY